jgi:amino acid transporter
MQATSRLAGEVRRGDLGQIHLVEQGQLQRAALAVTSGIGALNGWTLVTTEVARAAANDGLFPRAFAWTDRKDTAWFDVVMAALGPRC